MQIYDALELMCSVNSQTSHKQPCNKIIKLLDGHWTSSIVGFEVKHDHDSIISDHSYSAWLCTSLSDINFLSVSKNDTWLSGSVTDQLYMYSTLYYVFDPFYDWSPPTTSSHSINKFLSAVCANSVFCTCGGCDILEVPTRLSRRDACSPLARSFVRQPRCCSDVLLSAYAPPLPHTALHSLFILPPARRDVHYTSVVSSFFSLCSLRCVCLCTVSVVHSLQKLERERVT